jgi:hypothetical protein
LGNEVVMGVAGDEVAKGLGVGDKVVEGEGWARTTTRVGNEVVEGRRRSRQGLSDEVVGGWSTKSG